LQIGGSEAGFDQGSTRRERFLSPHMEAGWITPYLHDPQSQGA
jgi:hypothetical protein